MNQVTTAFDDIVDTYYHAWFRYHPEAAVDAGVEGYAHLLTPCDDDARGALVCLNDELRAGLDELDQQALDAERALDRQLLLGAVQVENQQLLDIWPLHPDPHRALPVHALYQLTIRPVADPEAALRARLAAVPAHLEVARSSLQKRAQRIPLPWLTSAAVAARRGAEFTRALTRHPRFAALAGLKAMVEPAAQALHDYAAFLETELAPRAAGRVACDQVHFETLLQLRHFLDVPLDTMRVFGEELVARTRAELQATCREVAGTAEPAKVLARLHANHPSRDGLLVAYREAMQAAREFVRTHELVTLPGRERLDVVETPIFLRHQIPFAAYCEPTPNDPAQQGYYYVTPPQSEAELAEHDVLGLRHTCVHEAWPGHHLQFVTANLNPAARRLPRLLNASATFYEGWALYSEQLMQEAGFLAAPEGRIVLLRDRLWRALRILIDIDIHTRDVSLETAAGRLVTELGFPRSQADAELNWYSRAPTVPLGYATGWALINALRDFTGVAPASRRQFHDRLLSQGSFALPLVIRRAFGEPAWTGVRQRVFGGAA